MTSNNPEASTSVADALDNIHTGLLPRRDPRIRYWLEHQALQNFGDYLSEFLARGLVRRPKVDADAFHLIGSVIHDWVIEKDLRRTIAPSRAKIAFWCCGVRTPEGAPIYRKRALLFGARGPLTRTALNLPEDTALGDPGLLVPLLHAARPHSETVGRSICIPHILDDRGDEALLAISGADVVLRPAIKPSIPALLEVIDKIASAEFILSASLHGAILAFAYDRPFCFWDNGHLDVPVKWSDFSLSVGFEAQFRTTVLDGKRAYEREIEPHLRCLSLSAILDVCPFTVNPVLLMRALVADKKLSLEEARAAEPLIARLDQLDAAQVAIDLARMGTLGSGSLSSRIQFESWKILRWGASAAKRLRPPH
jgi:hypothetical protein